MVKEGGGGVESKEAADFKFRSRFSCRTSSTIDNEPFVDVLVPVSIHCLYSLLSSQKGCRRKISHLYNLIILCQLIILFYNIVNGHSCHMSLVNELNKI